MTALRRHYGATSVHLLAHLVALPLAAWAILQVVDFRGARDVVVWFVAALVLHDLVALPAYTALDRVAQRARVRGVAVVNHLRVPAVMSGVTLLVFFPLILGRSTGSLHYLSGVTPTGYLGRWLLVVAAAWGGSAAVLGVRLLRADDLHDAGGAPGDHDGAQG
ncbi:hypothetical protein FSW04_16350 [Baekduia soli]|uniref:Uncharacterized protein n=1 Tax=Baekduia soli TaxID=496014 RepID=A0A5B8U852_9ACTN|nr:hypothetical protein [Baekduia soli]QEC48988.1 hypothetical protein FSW04_16350 [Baekduia soli]